MIQGVKYVIKEHIDNSSKIMALSIASTRKHFVGTSLGIFWSLWKDVVYLSTYYFFVTFVYGAISDIEGAPRMVYLFSGLLPWFFMMECLSLGAQSLIRNKTIFTKIKFPISIIGTYETLSIFYRRSLTYLFGFLIFAIYGYLQNLNVFAFIYYNFAMILLMMAFIQLISGVIAISKDIGELYNSIVRILVFFHPILWAFNRFEGVAYGEILAKIVMLNPMVYIILGFRQSLGITHYVTLNYHIYFWVLLLVMFILGANMQYNLRKYYADFI